MLQGVGKARSTTGKFRFLCSSQKAFPQFDGILATGNVLGRNS
jgi:hypothetical protein